MIGHKKQYSSKFLTLITALLSIINFGILIKVEYPTARGTYLFILTLKFIISCKDQPDFFVENHQS